MEQVAPFAELYERESEAILGFLTHHTRDAELARDLTADTFAIALDSWSRLEVLEPEQARAWLFTVARRQWARHLRRAGVQRRALTRLRGQSSLHSDGGLAELEERSQLGQ